METIAIHNYFEQGAHNTVIPAQTYFEVDENESIKSLIERVRQKNNWLALRTSSSIELKFIEEMLTPLTLKEDVR